MLSSGGEVCLERVLVVSAQKVRHHVVDTVSEMR